MSLVSVPTLDELAADLGKVRALPAAVARDLLPRLLSLQTALLAQALTLDGNGHGGEGATEDRLLDVKEAAALLGTTEDWLYRHARKLPFRMTLGPRQLRFSARGIERYIRNRQGR